MSNCNNNSNNNCPAAEKYYNTSGKRFNVADVNAGCAAGPPYYGQQNRNVNCGNAEMMGSPDMSASCPPGRRYNKAGRPFTRADINTFAANTGNLISETCSQDESSYNQSRGPPLNPSPRSRNVLAQSAPMGRCFDHEEEMARNQQIALHRLRAELETNACQRSPDRSPERSPVRSKRTCPTPPAKCRLEPVNSGSYRGRSFDPQAEIERQKAKANMCLAKKDRNVLAGRRIDLDRLVDYNVQSCEAYTAGGRRMDVDRDLNRRLPSPKGQRASSCPTPMPSVAQCAPGAARPAQVCPQHSAAACPSPTRSANTSRSNSPNCPNTARSPMRCPATPTVCPPTPAPPCNITVTTTTRRNISSNSGYSPCPLESFVDLTDETANDCSMRQPSQYSNQTSDMSGRDRTNGSACQNNSRNSNASNCATPPPVNCSANAWQNPPQNMSCNDGNNYQNRMSSTMNPSGFGNTFCVDDMMDSEYMCDACNKTYLPNRPCPPEIKPGSTCPPRASIFRCLAKKLSSTYDFISSFVSNSEPKSQPECATSPQPECSRPSSSSGQNCCPYSSPNDTTNYGMERLFETQHNPNAPTGKPGSIQECANAKRCGRVQFDSSDSPLEPNQKAIRKAQVETLVNDSFCPGLIQATIDGQENFNNYAFNITLGKDAKDTSKCDRPPPEEPITLLEAFSLRIAQERENVNKQLPTNAAADQIIDIIDKEFAAKLPSDLNRSIKDLLLSERTKEHEQVEQAKEKSFDSEVQKVRTSFPDNPKVKLDVYTGHTNPSND